MDIIPLPYVKVFTNEEGDIEILCNLNNAPELECDVFAMFLINDNYTSDQHLRVISSNGTTSITEVMTVDEEDERALELYTTPINAEFRLYKDFTGKYRFQKPKEAHTETIEAAIMRKALKVVDEAIYSRFHKNS
jgi:hypothetical protein